MSLPLTVSRHMTQSITIETPASRDKSGKRSYAAPVTYSKCRVIRDHQVTVDAKGEEQVSKVQVLIDQDLGIDEGSRVTLPDGSQPPIIQVIARPRSAVGQDMGYTEIWL